MIRLFMAMIAVGIGGVVVRAADATAQEKPGHTPASPVAVYRAVFPASHGAPPRKVPTQLMPDGPLLGNGDMAVAVGAYGRHSFWLTKNDFWQLKNGSGGPRVFGWIYLDMPGLGWGGYRATQNFADGMLSATLSSASHEVGMKAWVAATENLLVVELTLLKGAPLSSTVTLRVAGQATAENPFPRVSEASRQGVFWGARGFSPQVADIPVEAACALRLLGTEGTDVKEAPDVESFNWEYQGPERWRWGYKAAFTPVGQSFTLAPGKPVTLMAALISKRQTADYLQAAQQVVAKADAGHMAELKARHDAWWSDYWGKSFVALNDPFLEWRYYASLYVLGACSRDPDFPPGIMGSWTTTDFPGWRGDYTLDYNAHAPFYGLNAGNRLAQADAHDGPMLAFMEKGRNYSRLLFGHDGVLYPVGIGPLGCNTTEGHGAQYGEHQNRFGCQWLNMKSNASFCMVNMAERWFMTRDLTYARRVYPFVCEVATFWEQDLKFENGRYSSHRDGARECTDDVNPLPSLSLIPLVMRTALDMSEALDTDAGRREKWRHIQSHISPFPTWSWPSTGKMVFRESEAGTRWVNGNTMPIFPVYPAGAIGLDSDPQLLAIARNTVEAMAEGSAQSPLQDIWYDVNGQSSWYPALARIGYDPRVILTALRGLRFNPNGVVINDLHGLENSSVFPNTINEMLLHSHQDVLRLFPCWPKDKDARFGTLRAYGAFLVSAELKVGVVGGVTILSEKGRDCTLVNPWPGKAVTLVRNGQVAETLKGERFTFKTAAGERIEFKVN